MAILQAVRLNVLEGIIGGVCRVTINNPKYNGHFIQKHLGNFYII